jgi:heme/copper-type cytochrome/quinol oxidase subunit 1
MPILFGGLGNIIMPVLLGVSEVAYPRVNNISL